MISPGDTVLIAVGEELRQGTAIFVKPQSIFVSWMGQGSEWVAVSRIVSVVSEQTKWRELLELSRNLYLATPSLLHRGQLDSVFAIHEWLEKYDEVWWRLNADSSG